MLKLILDFVFFLSILWAGVNMVKLVHSFIPGKCEAPNCPDVYERGDERYCVDFNMKVCHLCHLKLHAIGVYWLIA